jgi:hypothetical protein
LLTAWHIITPPAGAIPDPRGPRGRGPRMATLHYEKTSDGRRVCPECRGDDFVTVQSQGDVVCRVRRMGANPAPPRPAWRCNTPGQHPPAPMLPPAPAPACAAMRPGAGVAHHRRALRVAHLLRLRQARGRPQPRGRPQQHHAGRRRPEHQHRQGAGAAGWRRGRRAGGRAAGRAGGHQPSARARQSPGSPPGAPPAPRTRRWALMMQQCP